MDAALVRAAQFEELVATARQKLTEALEDHIGRYCHSFSAETGENEIRCVQEYENNITRWRGVVRESLALLDDILRSMKEAGPTFENYVLSYDKILHYMHLALEVRWRLSVCVGVRSLSLERRTSAGCNSVRLKAYGRRE